MPDPVPDILKPLGPPPYPPPAPMPVGFWAKFKASFGNSETVLWARLQVVFGVLGSVALPVWIGLSQTDLSPVIHNSQYLTGWLVFNGIVTEFLRRRRQFP